MTTLLEKALAVPAGKRGARTEDGLDAALAYTRGQITHKQLTTGLGKPSGSLYSWLCIQFMTAIRDGRLVESSDLWDRQEKRGEAK